VSALSQILVLPAVKEKYSMKLQADTIKPFVPIPDGKPATENSTAGDSTASATCAEDDYTCNG